MGATGPLLDRITDISKTLGVTQDAAKRLLQIVGQGLNVRAEPADALSNDELQAIASPGDGNPAALARETRSAQLH